MNSYPVLDVAISMVFVYLIFSILVSGVAELWQMVMKDREYFMFKALSEVFNDRRNMDFVYLMYSHPLVDTLKRNRNMFRYLLDFFGKHKKDKSLPAYISNASFSGALYDTIANRSRQGFVFQDGKYVTKNVKGGRPSAQDFNSAVKDLNHSKVKTLLESFIPSEEVVHENTIRNNIEFWFQEYMKTTSSWYRIHMAKRLMIIGIVFAVLLNIDSVFLLKTFWKDKALRETTAQIAAQYVESNPVMKNSDSIEVLVKNIQKSYDQLNMLSLPIGWSGKDVDRFWDMKFVDKILRILGWIISGFAISYGSDRLFAVLQSLLKMKTGATTKGKEVSNG